MGSPDGRLLCFSGATAGLAILAFCNPKPPLGVRAHATFARGLRSACAETVAGDFDNFK